jgi:hypothetical protein
MPAKAKPQVGVVSKKASFIVQPPRAPTGRAGPAG